MVTSTYKACLMIKDGLYKVRHRCKTLSEARLWAMAEAKKLVADSYLTFDDVSVKIDEKKNEWCNWVPPNFIRSMKRWFFYSKHKK